MIKKTYEKGIKLILSGIIGVLLIFGISCIVITLPYQICAWVLAKVFRRDLRFFVTGPNIVMTSENYENDTVNLINIAILNGKISSQDFREKFRERIVEARDPENGNLIYGRLKEVYTTFMGYTFWARQDSKFKLESHVRDYDCAGDLSLPSPCYEEDLRRVMGGLISQGWTKGQSPWEVLVVQNYGADGNSCLILRNHHSIMDGYSIIDLWRRLSGRKWEAIGMPKSGHKRRMTVGEYLTFPIRGLREMGEMMYEMVEGQSQWWLGDTDRDYVTCLSPQISVKLVKKIKNLYGVSYAAVLFSGLCGGFSRLLKEVSGDVPLELAALVVFPKPNHPGGTTNYAVLLNSRWALKARSAKERVTQIEASMKRLKSSTVPLAMDLTMMGLACLPRALARFFLYYCVLGGSSMFASSFPISDDSFYLDDLKMVDILSSFGGFGRNIGMTFLTTGTEGQMRMVVNMDKRLLPSQDTPSKLGKYIAEEFDILLKEKL